MAETRHTQPKVTTADLKRKYDTVIVVNRGQFRLRLFKDLKLTKTYGIAVGQVGLETPAGQYTIANKAVNPAWHVPNSAWAGKLAGKVIPGDDPTNPIKARWLGIFDGVGIHGTVRRRLDRPQRLARLHPHARPGRRGALRRGPGRLRRSTSPRGACSASDAARPDLVDRRPPPSPRSRSRAWWSECRSTSVPMKTPRSRLRRTANHSVEASRRALDAMPRARRLPVRADGARVDELAMGGDLTVAGVDEEHPHGRGG